VLELLPLTVPEVRRLLLALAEPPERFSFHLAWSLWRRQRQAVAMHCHAARRARHTPAPGHASERPAARHEHSDQTFSTDLTGGQWSQIAALLPAPRRRLGRPLADLRLMITAMRWVEQTGCSWRALPARFGPWQDVYARYHRWRQTGLWWRIRQILDQPADRHMAT